MSSLVNTLGIIADVFDALTYIGPALIPLDIPGDVKASMTSTIAAWNSLPEAQRTSIVTSLRTKYTAELDRLRSEALIVDEIAEAERLRLAAEELLKVGEEIC